MAIDRIASTGRISHAATQPIAQRVPDLESGDPGEVNAHLRRLWAAVQITPDMSVAEVEWIVPDWMHDEAAYAELEASADKR